jgi:hypothetical protein
MTSHRSREAERLAESYAHDLEWVLWGPYLTERAWGTVREDYGADGDTWGYFPHDHARSRAYRWTEDGLAGICDRHQYLCLAIALWNGNDPILKERAFGLNGREGNHGEDVKEYYFYLDSTPTHSYLRYVYKYPQAPFPYDRLLDENRRRDRTQPEFELVDTGVFGDGRYFDLEVEYAKAAPDDVWLRVRATNRGSEPAPLHLLPTLWFRNTWIWGRDPRRPSLERAGGRVPAMRARHHALGEYLLYCGGADELIFTENETNARRLFGAAAGSPYVKDAFHDYVIHGAREAVNPEARGTKAAAVYRRRVPAGDTVTLTLRLAAAGGVADSARALDGGDEVLAARRQDADEFYAALLGGALPAEAAGVARQAWAGLLWSKQYYHYVVRDWLDGDPALPPPPAERRQTPNAAWGHLFNRDVVLVPDKWEFPWYASWDLAFHAVAMAPVDPQFAKQQLILMLREWYMHPNGQVPACEWNLGAVNPPVQAWAAGKVSELEERHTGTADRAFLERVFHKLLLNFDWWVNREDPAGNNIFQGGFLGLDNVGLFDRSRPLPPGYLLGQADGTSWMAMYCQSMLGIALRLAAWDAVYEDVASKFWQHFLYIANAMNHIGGGDLSLWDEEDGFFYDVLRLPDGTREPLRTRSVVGLTPLIGVVASPRELLDRNPEFRDRRRWFIEHRPDLTRSVAPMDQEGENGLLLMSVVREDQLRRILTRMLDEEEFLSPYGIRSVSRYHRDHPFVARVDGLEHRLDYEPGESTIPLFGGNSNWRGPVWMPLNYLLIEALRRYGEYYGTRFLIECPTGSGRRLTLRQVAAELARRVARLFLRDAGGRRPAAGEHALLQRDPAWRDLVPFPEYFDGDTGRGCGASHQTGWTALITNLLLEWPEAGKG